MISFNQPKSFQTNLLRSGSNPPRGLLSKERCLRQKFLRDKTTCIGIRQFFHTSIRLESGPSDRIRGSTKSRFAAFSDLQVYESHDEKYLREIGEEARTKDLILHAGTGGICPTSQSFKDTFGSADEHLQLLLKVAHGVGSKVARCYLGSDEGPEGTGRH